MSQFLKNLSLDLSKFTKKVGDSEYLPWATSLNLACSPRLSSVRFGRGRPYLKLFGGVLVAVDQAVEGGEHVQRTYLPILDNRYAPVPVERVTSRDISDAVNRCRARSVATVSGIGLSLYSPCGADGAWFVEALKVTPDSNLSEVDELRERKEIKDKQGNVKSVQEYLGWHTALSAARITDPNFHWSILEFEEPDPATGELATIPACQVDTGKGWMVAVKVCWKGREHIEWLPIMGIAMVQTKNGIKPLDHQPIEDPNVMQWQQAVMRCLAKAIAICTGYGIKMYAGELAISWDDAADDADVSDGASHIREDGQRAAVAVPAPVVTTAAEAESEVKAPQEPAAPSPVPEPVPETRRAAPKDALAEQLGSAPPEAMVPLVDERASEQFRKETIGRILHLVKETGSDLANLMCWLGAGGTALENAESGVLERAEKALLAKLNRAPVH